MATKSSSSSSTPEETPPEEAPAEAAPTPTSKLGGTAYTSLVNDTFGIGTYPQTTLVSGQTYTSEDLPGDLLDQLVDQGLLLEVKEGESIDLAKQRQALERQQKAEADAKEAEAAAASSGGDQVTTTGDVSTA